MRRQSGGLQKSLNSDHVKHLLNFFLLYTLLGSVVLLCAGCRVANMTRDGERESG